MKHRANRSHQSGIIMLIVLVALAVLLSAAVALVRSSDVFQRQAGNLAFRRDLQNQAERGIKSAIVLLNTGGLSTEAARISSAPSLNYSAAQLSADAHGIPDAILSDAGFSAAGMTGSDITDSEAGITVRTVIDRQCAAVGAYSTTGCVTVSSGTTDPAGDSRHKAIQNSRLPVYRITVRASGPHNTQLFMQATVVR